MKQQATTLGNDERRQGGLGFAPSAPPLDEDAIARDLGTGGRAFVVFCARSTQVFLTNNNMQMAAAIAFYSFFSLFPLSLLIILVYDVFQPQATAPEQAHLARALGAFIPVSQDVIASSIKTAVESRVATGPLALGTLVWASTAMFATLRKGINSAWNLRVPRPWLRERVIDLAATTGAGLLFMALLIATAALREFAEDDSTAAIGLLSAPVWLSVSSLLMTFFAFTMVYRYLPNRPLKLRDVLFGALMAAIAFEIAKGVFFLYTQQRATVDSIYGPLTSGAVLLGWLYTSAAIVLIGALTAAIYTRLTERRIVTHMAIWTFGVWPGVKKAQRFLRRQAVQRAMQAMQAKDRVTPRRKRKG
ncbi:MAG: YihY/virulence factor BrkB family protein [Dehalococcoidia bacterium]|nr:YihY/virulence factor BrkB family protein [Dehalococcoidia bacterium]